MAAGGEVCWYVYIVRCSDATFYTGIATDVARRMTEHNQDNQLAARYTRARRPVSLIYCEPFTSRSLAAQREYAIKQLTRR
ncbi:MAG: putative endonuclease, partial [Halothiobacillaceae bacterium]